MTVAAMVMMAVGERGGVDGDGGSGRASDASRGGCVMISGARFLSSSLLSFFFIFFFQRCW